MKFEELKVGDKLVQKGFEDEDVFEVKCIYKEKLFLVHEEDAFVIRKEYFQKEFSIYKEEPKVGDVWLNEHGRRYEILALLKSRSREYVVTETVNFWPNVFSKEFFHANFKKEKQ